MKIFLIGWFGAGNMGDEAILLSELHFLRSRIANAEFLILSFDPGRTERLTARIPEVKGIVRMGAGRDVLKSDISGLLKAFRETDLVVIGGGGIFQDLYNSYPIPFFTTMVFLARRNRKPVILYSVGIGPVRTYWGKTFSRYAASAADFVSVRDAESAALLRSLGVPGPIHLSADPVFLLNPVLSEKAARVIQGLEGSVGSPLIGVCVQELLAWDARKQKVLAEVLDALVERQRVRVVFLPFGAYNDRRFGRERHSEPVDIRASKKLAALMREQASILSDDLQPEEMLAVMQRMEVVVSMRLHGLIMGLAVGVPVVALTYPEESKLANLMNRLGQKDRLFDVRTIEKDALLEVIHFLLSAKKQVRRVLSDEIAALRAQADSCNERLLERFSGKTVPERSPVDSAAFQ